MCSSDLSANVKYNVCNNININKYKNMLMDGTFLGTEILAFSYNKDKFPLLIWLCKALPNLTSIPNEHREFINDFLAFDELRLFQKYIKTSPECLTKNEIDNFNRILNRINQR